MKTSEEIKSLVKKQYSTIALQEKNNLSSCCDSSCCTEVNNFMADDYKHIKGYQPEADLGLGCGLPTEFASIQKGDVVIDLGSGAGNDCFIARAETGERGKVIGIDMTEAMIQRARKNAEQLNFNNVEFRLGEIENLPVTSELADVIVSNCVLNLVPDKQKAFSEIYRVLKQGGHFSISDIVLEGNLPQKIMDAVEMYTGCVAGAIQKEDYLNIIRRTGFENIIIQKSIPVLLPDSLLSDYLSSEEIQEYKNHPPSILSITVYGKKTKSDCCDKTSCCK